MNYAAPAFNDNDKRRRSANDDVKMDSPPEKDKGVKSGQPSKALNTGQGSASKWQDHLCVRAMRARLNRLSQMNNIGLACTASWLGS